jgi:hypothetical protein
MGLHTQGQTMRKKEKGATEGNNPPVAILDVTDYVSVIGLPKFLGSSLFSMKL